MREKNKSQSQSFKRQSGFTLMEMLVVLSIISLLSTSALVNTNRARALARDTRRLADINAIFQALQMYYYEFGYVPWCTYSTYQLKNGEFSSGCDLVGTRQDGSTYHGDTTQDGIFVQFLWPYIKNAQKIKDPLNDPAHLYLYGNGIHEGVNYDFLVGALLENPRNPALKYGIPYPGVPQYYILGQRSSFQPNP